MNAECRTPSLSSAVDAVSDVEAGQGGDRLGPVSRGQCAEASSPPVSVSVVIPAYHGATTISETLRSLAEQTGVQRPEVIVVESSADGAADIIAREFPWVTVLRQSARLSAGAARNRGASLAKGDYVLFIDQDCIAPSDWIARIVAHLQQPGVDAVGGSVGIANPANLSGAAVYTISLAVAFSKTTCSFCWGATLDTGLKCFAA